MFKRLRSALSLKRPYFLYIGQTFLLPLPLILVACRSEPIVIRSTQIVRIQVTATRSAPGSTPSPFPAPAETPIPTHTAIPIDIAGNPIAESYFDPVPAAGAYCGYVDTFDFPMNPPNADGMRGGQDFGVYRRRFGKYHAGEDWGFRGGSSFGEPVYAIGHGTVTFADGLGWGPDQGVVIIRHYFEDGSTVLSFYGHLDPPSVTLAPGTCVTRGEQVGSIGRPRSSPHLHFEIRTTMPFVPGPGYWEEDPTTAGWLPPSAYINAHRMAQIPGVAWVRTDLDVDLLLGEIEFETLVVREGNRLLGLYSPAGGVRWTHELQEPVAGAVLSEMDGRIYVLQSSGVLTALRVPETGQAMQTGRALVSDWEVSLLPRGRSILAPSPWGGVILHTIGGLTAVDSEGRVLWTHETAAQIESWTQFGEQIAVVLAGERGGLWVFGMAGVAWRLSGGAGRVVAADEGMYLLRRNGLDLFRPGEFALGEVLHFAEGFFPGVISPVPGGGAVVLHSDLSVQTLFFVREGQLVWKRSLDLTVSSSTKLVSDRNDVYLLMHGLTGSAEEIELFRIDLETPGLTRIFTGGSRQPAPGKLSYSELAGSGFVIRFGERSLLVFNPFSPVRSD